MKWWRKKKNIIEAKNVELEPELENKEKLVWKVKRKYLKNKIGK